MQIGITRVTQNFAVAAVMVTAFVAGSTTAWATAIPIADSGVLQVGNSVGTLVGITGNPGCINWGGGATCLAGTNHTMSVSGSSNLFAVGAPATIQDLTSLTPTNVINFETVTGAGALTGQTVHFDLASFVIGAGFGNCASNAAFNTCNLAGSAFSLSEDSSGTQVSLSFTALLNAYTGTSATGTSSYRAIFTSQYSGSLTGTGACSGITASITNILGCETAGGTVTSTWSATESPITATPEPFSFTLVASGLLGLAVYRRRSRCV